MLTGFHSARKPEGKRPFARSRHRREVTGFHSARKPEGKRPFARSRHRREVI